MDDLLDGYALGWDILRKQMESEYAKILEATGAIKGQR